VTGLTGSGIPFSVAAADAVASSAHGTTCALSGRIADLGALAPEYDPRPEQWAHAVAAGWDEHGERALEELRGEFVVAIWSPRDGRGVVARDQLGGRTLFWTTVGGRLAFAEELRDLLPLLERTPDPDRVAATVWLAEGVWPLGRSCFEGIARLGPGRLLRAEGTAVREATWWQPRYQPPLDAPADQLAELVGDAVDAAVRRSMRGSERPAVLLSGGLDSTTVAAAATRAGRPVAYSGVFPEHDAVDEATLIDDVTGFLEIEAVREEIRPAGVLRGALDYMREWGMPVASPNHALWRPLLEHARAHGIDALLDGEGGDEVFGGAPYAIADRLRRGGVRSAWRLTRALTGMPADASNRRVAAYLRIYGLKGALPHGLHDRLRRSRGPLRHVPAHLGPVAGRLVLDNHDPIAWKRGSGPLWWRHQAYLLTTMRELLDAHGYLRRRATEAGLDPRHPFLHDVDLVELVLRLPPEPRFDRDRDRVLLRRAMAGRLPDSVRLRRGKAYFNPLLTDALEGPDGAAIDALLRDPAARVRQIVDGAALDAHLLDAPAPATGASRADRNTWLWRLGVMECWLRSIEDASFDVRDRGALGLVPF
jgi:asparagine synthase (glutamine-hydrolysing)